MVLITPIIRSINIAFPEAKISILGFNLYNSGFLLCFPNVTELRALDIYSLDMRQILKPFFWKTSLQTITFLRRRRFDLLISFRFLKLIDWLFMEWVFVFLSKAGYTIGINPNFLPFRSVYRKWKTEAELAGQHYIESFLQLLETAGIPAGPRETVFPISETAKKSAESMLPSTSLTSCRVCIHPGGTRLALESEQWHPSNYASIVEYLTEKGAFTILIGSAQDLKIAETTCKDNPTCLNLAGRTTVEEMAAVIKRVDLFIGSDSGPFHVAVAVGTPAIGIFTRTMDEPEYYNYNLKNVYVFREYFTERATVNGVLAKAYEFLSASRQ